MKKETFGYYLKQLRKQKRLTQMDLSQASELSKSYISFLESSLRHPSRDVVLRLSEILAPQQEEVRDHFLILAGFVPENPAHLSKQPLFMLSDAPPASFSAYLQEVLLLIRQGNDEMAQKRLEQGFQRFSKPAQMQTLLAHLELSRGNFEHAVLSQQTALQHYHLMSQEQIPGFSHLDLILNLGVMYFLWGDRFLFARQAAEAEGDQVKAEQNKQAALEKYVQALEQFEKGIKLDSEYLYLLDEYARIHFNLADLLPAEQASRHWQQAIDAYQKVIAHPAKHQIPAEHLRESALFLGLALSKMKRFEPAALVLNVLSLSPPQSWLMPYIQACHYALKYQAQAQQADLLQARRCLERAIRIDSAALQQMQQDLEKDLQVLKNDSQIRDLLNQK